MERELFEKFCRIVHQKCGIYLREGKEALVRARIGKRLRALGIPDARSYLEFLQTDPSGDEVIHFLDAISTNVTRFFREDRHFGTLEEHLRSLAAGGQRRIRIWSAGCSTGQEPYSIAMILDELLDRSLDWKILATDLSTKVLKVAEAGVYSGDRMEGIPPAMVKRCFEPDTMGGPGSFRVKPELRQRIVFKRLNLVDVPFPMKGPFDAIFCRNVMIYFDPEGRERLLREFIRLLSPKGLLFLGLSESLAGLDVPIINVQPAVFRRKIG